MKGFLIYISFFLFGWMGNPVTEYSKIYEQSVLIEEGWLSDGLRNGYWKFYYDNGSIRAEGHYEKGLRDQFWTQYSKENFKESEGHYEKGLRSEWWTFFNAAGERVLVQEYKEGKKNGYSFTYKNEEVIRAEYFEDDVKTNEWFDYLSFIRENQF